MTAWCRLWEDMPTDPKWRVIARRSGQPLPCVIALFNMLMVNANANTAERGTLSSWDDEDAAAALDMEPEAVTAIMEAMQGKVLDGLRLTGWEKRQPKREDGTAAERKAAWKERQARGRAEQSRPDTDGHEQERTGTHRNASERKPTPRNAPEAEAEAEAEEIDIAPTALVELPSDASEPGTTVNQAGEQTGQESDYKITPREVVESWNVIAARMGKAQVIDLTPARITAIKCRIAQNSLDDFSKVFVNFETSAFLGKKKAMGFDWLMKRENFQKTLEGNYND